MGDEKPPVNNGDVMKALGLFMHIGTIVAVNIAAGVILGRFLDGFLGTGSIMMFVFIGLGTASAFWAAYRLIMKSIK